MMVLEQSIDRLITSIGELDREECIHELRSLHRPRIDFTDEYLDALSLDRLRHILAAAMIQAHRARGNRS